MKTCKKCGALFEGKVCLPCNREACREWKRKNRDKVAAYNKAAYKKDAEAGKARTAEWRRKNSNAVRDYSKKYSAENKEKVKKAQANWRRKNSNAVREYNREYRKNHPEKVKAWRKNGIPKRYESVRVAIARWKLANRGKMRAYVQNRRAKQREVGGRLSPGLAANLFKLQRGKCACGCGQNLGKDYHMDHIMPVSLGGANVDSNMQLLTKRCNLEKHAKHPIDFMQSRGFLC